MQYQICKISKSVTKNNSKNKIMITTIGGSGYTAGELIRILMFHPHATIDFVFSTTNAGKPLSVAS
jgi:N-acetyl-gamma-glutamylphosphate reductase